MANSFDSDDDLSTALGPETLAERDMVPEGFNNTPRPSPSVPVEIWMNRRFLRVDQSANLHAGSVTSKIWDHGFKYRSLDNRLRDKYWRCKHCKYLKLWKITGAIYSGNIY
jgi:hypothetical protein